ncbi:serine hydrolase domain-containing protein [Rhizobium sp. CF080]|uniref:serine hydrolase domain-containing protein n=1 Tax=Rhizobium sp. (strain CF080) TaxID=1144310 RepID=UPI00030BE69E|nr:serine hydrolase domain-containing protein [Rhizobium sp. CF080]
MTIEAADDGITGAAARAFELVRSAVDEGRIPGGVLGVVDRSGSRTVLIHGSAQIFPDRRPMTRETWFDLASLTKVIFTTTRILHLAVVGTIDLDAPLTSVIPDFRQQDMSAWERQVTFRQCLGHQTHFPATTPLYIQGLSPHLLRTFVLQREWPKGESVYSDMNFILLGFALERLMGEGIRDMNAGPGFAFSAPPELSAATEQCPWRQRMICGEVHDENCAALEGAGHAGLFGTADAVLDFAAGLLDGDAKGDPVVQMMRQPLSEKRAHGWERRYAGWSGGDDCSAATIGHTGFTGTGLWIDFERGRAWTLLTNRIHPTRHFDSGIFDLRRQVGDAVCAS